MILLNASHVKIQGVQHGVAVETSILEFISCTVSIKSIIRSPPDFDDLTVRLEGHTLSKQVFIKQC
jgi:hypothetical protein